MNKRLKLLGIFITASLCCYAQTKEFDPSLDPNVTIVSRQSQEEWNSRYMWYPGQLAAFYQQQCARISKERCVNVGYPGKFFAKNNTYPITVGSDRTFDLSGLPGNFKPEKVQQWNGGSVKSGTSILTVDKGVSQVTYTYDCGFSRKAVFTLRVTETGSAPGVTNDANATRKVSYAVTDDGAGHLSVVRNGDDGAAFEHDHA